MNPPMITERFSEEVGDILFLVLPVDSKLEIQFE